MTDFNNSFTAAEYADAREAFASWQTKTDETVDAYVLRKRKAELYALVRTVIKNELTPAQQKLVRLLWYEGMNHRQAADFLGINRSTVARNEEKINEIIYSKLKYAMEYRYGKSFSENSKLIIKSNTQICFPADGDSISRRLHNLRLQQSLCPGDVAAMTGIKKSRIEEIEKEGQKITAEEISVLTKLFGTTSDYIIFGISTPSTLRKE